MALANILRDVRGYLPRLTPDPTPGVGLGLVPPEGKPKEFAEAATEALHVALRRYVPGPEPYYNVYLDRGLGFQGLTAHLLLEQSARWKRKLAFTQSGVVWWAITFARGQGKALVEHRSGYRARYQKP